MIITGYGLIALGLLVFIYGAAIYQRNQSVEQFNISDKNRFLTVAYGHAVLFGLALILAGLVLSGLVTVK